MRLNLLRAIKSTHRNPLSRTLHVIGLSLYIAGIVLIIGYSYNGQDISRLIYGIILFPIAIGLFLVGHKIEGNLRAMTFIMFFMYLKCKLSFR